MRQRTAPGSYCCSYSQVGFVPLSTHRGRQPEGRLGDVEGVKRSRGGRHLFFILPLKNVQLCSQQRENETARDEQICFVAPPLLPPLAPNIPAFPPSMSAERRLEKPPRPCMPIDTKKRAPAAFPATSEQQLFRFRFRKGCWLVRARAKFSSLPPSTAQRVHRRCYYTCGSA